MMCFYIRATFLRLPFYFSPSSENNGTHFRTLNTGNLPKKKRRESVCVWGFSPPAAHIKCFTATRATFYCQVKFASRTWINLYKFAPRAEVIVQVATLQTRWLKAHARRAPADRPQAAEKERGAREFKSAPTTSFSSPAAAFCHSWVDFNSTHCLRAAWNSVLSPF